MIKNKNGMPESIQNRTGGLRAVEQSEVQAIGDVENIVGMDEIKDTTEDALDEIYLPDYGGSE